VDIKGALMNNKFVKETLDWIYAIVLALVIAMVIHIFIVCHKLPFHFLSNDLARNH